MASRGKHSASDHGWTSARSVAGLHNPWTIIGVISIATFMVVLDLLHRQCFAGPYRGQPVGQL